jgi:hypothetical protein
VWRTTLHQPHMTFAEAGAEAEAEAELNGRPRRLPQTGSPSVVSVSPGLRNIIALSHAATRCSFTAVTCSPCTNHSACRANLATHDALVVARRSSRTMGGPVPHG